MATVDGSETMVATLVGEVKRHELDATDAIREVKHTGAASQGIMYLATAYEWPVPGCAR